MSPVACWEQRVPKPVRSPSRDDLPKMSCFPQPEDRCVVLPATCTAGAASGALTRLLLPHGPAR